MSTCSLYKNFIKGLNDTMLDHVIYKILGGVKFARNKGVALGEGCRILTRHLGSEPWLISIGNRVTVSSDVVFINHDGSGWLHRDTRGRRYRYAKIEIGDDVFVGARVIIMPGVRIGSNCVIGAGSVLTKSVPSGTVAAGNPARYVCSYDQFISKVETWASESDMAGTDRRQNVNSIAEAEFKQEMKSEISNAG